MGDQTNIEWCDASWNPIVGCSIVSPGCTNCYAMRMAGRLERMRTAALSHYAGATAPSKAGDVWTGKVALAPDRIVNQPFAWKRPRRIFVNSMGDLFHESVPDEWIDRVFAVMALAGWHTFIVLTKRAKRMREYMTAPSLVPEELRADSADVRLAPNVWLGVSIEDQRRADERIPDLLATPAAVRFVSAEPLLGAIDFTAVPLAGGWRDLMLRHGEGRLNWIIAGGESGPGARPSLRSWKRAIRDQCAAAGVPYFDKQNGEWIDADEWMEMIKRGGVVVMPGERFSATATPLDFTTAAFIAELSGSRFEHQSDGSTMIRVGKARAGRLLDGVEHNAFPCPSTDLRA